VCRDYKQTDLSFKRRLRVAMIAFVAVVRCIFLACTHTHTHTECLLKDLIAQEIILALPFGFQ